MARADDSRNRQGSSVGYMRKGVGLALIVLGVALAAYGITEYVRLQNTPCWWAGFCTSPESAIYILFIPGILAAVAGILVLAILPRKYRRPRAAK